tara:strand:- start:144 stop:398 length:255 start_codon:yes stop_codon:yes gene_type:complete
MTKDEYVKNIQTIVTVCSTRFPDIEANSPLLSNFYQQALDSSDKLIEFYNRLEEVLNWEIYVNISDEKEKEIRDFLKHGNTDED